MVSKSGIRVESLNYVSAGKRLLSNIDLALNCGELIAVVGPNGAGKTTLLHCIAGGLQAQAKLLCFQELDIQQTDTSETAQRIAVLPQQSSLTFPFSVEQVIELGLTPQKGLENKDAVLNEVIELLDLNNFRRQFFHTLSGGEKQRTHIARVLTQLWPKETLADKLLVLDEPISALDIRHTAELMNLLRELTKSGLTILISLHDLNLASRYADTIIALKTGQIEFTGATRKVLTSKSLSNLFDATIHCEMKADEQLSITY